MKLSSLLHPDRIACGLSARSKDEALDAVCELMAAHTSGITSAEIRSALTEREKMGPFSMAKGSAFPHARTEKISEFRIAVATSRAGIDFKAPDGIPIRLIALFLIPKKHSNLYLHTLAQFLNLFGAEGNLQRVVEAGTGGDLIAALDAISARPQAGPGTTPPVSVTADTPLGRAVELLTANRLETLPVVDASGALVGEVPGWALLRLGVGKEPAAGFAPHLETPLEELDVISSNGFQTVEEGEPPDRMALKLSQAGARGAYVVKGARLVGRITVGEILKRISGGGR